MFWQTEQDKQTLAYFRANNRRIAELKQELAEFRETINSTEDPDEFSWAVMMFKSVRHELDWLQS